MRQRFYQNAPDVQLVNVTGVSPAEIRHVVRRYNLVQIDGRKCPLAGRTPGDQVGEQADQASGGGGVVAWDEGRDQQSKSEAPLNRRTIALFREPKCSFGNTALGVVQGHADHADNVPLPTAKWFDVGLQVPPH